MRVGPIAFWSTAATLGGVALLLDSVPAALAILVSVPVCCVVCRLLEWATRWALVGATQDAADGN